MADRRASDELSFYEEVPADPSLQDPLPPSPLPLMARWMEEAKDLPERPNPDAMALGTVDPDGRPSARVVLARGLDLDDGFVVFYTNYHSPKGKALAANPRASGVLHWDPVGRQICLRGPVVKSPEEESDRYWARRPRPSQIAAWASSQSEPVASRAALLERIAEAEARFAGPDGGEVPRPRWWGGYRIWIERVELWVASMGRAHDRALWTRELTPSDGGFETGEWRTQRLQP